ncbi:MAG TPA: hypothetical protein VKF81_16530 [Blastocatellia bacterium]|nr:hypothetical protein [Blastocatellia bacterium]
MKYPIATIGHKRFQFLVALTILSFMAITLVPFIAGAQDSNTDAQAITAQQVEPKAGTWKTWLLTSGSQLRLAEPPNRRATKAEIKVLKAMESDRTAAALDLINFWDAGPPSYRWNEIANNEIVKNNVNTPRRARALALLNVAIYDAMIAAWDSKYQHNRLRPSELNPVLSTVLLNPQSPSYPARPIFVCYLARPSTPR